MHNSSPPEPAVSVVIPARNEERFIAGTLASVAAQTWPLSSLEAVVVDNGSSDGTGAAVRAFAAVEPRLAVTLVEHAPQGVAGAKNRGAAAARGRYLIFLDADSRLAPDLAAQVMKQVEAGAPAGSIRISADSDDRLDRAFFDLLEFGKVLFGVRAQMLYCSRELFLRFGGFPEGIRLAEDRAFLARLQRAGIRVCHVHDSFIATSPRRLHTLPFRLGMLVMLLRWALAYQGIGRRWGY
jgi:glycosyltransferase involved in cell wall biosynthesis